MLYCVRNYFDIALTKILIPVRNFEKDQKHWIILWNIIIPNKSVRELCEFVFVEKKRSEDKLVRVFFENLGLLNLISLLPNVIKIPMWYRYSECSGTDFRNTVLVIMIILSDHTTIKTKEIFLMGIWFWKHSSLSNDSCHFSSLIC